MEEAQQKCREGKDNPFFTKYFISSTIGKSYFVTLLLILIESSFSFAEDVRNLFKLKKETNETIKDKIITDYYQPLRLHNFWSNNYIEYESN